MFFVFDGIDGAGKSTQIARFVRWLQAAGRTVVECRDPGGTELGERIRDLLLVPSSLPIASRAETLLYMASRAQLVTETIAPALAAGKTVVSDRFVSANVAYQSFGSGMPLEELLAVADFAVGTTVPDLIFVLDLDVETAATRVGSTPDRIEARGSDYFRRVRDGFLALESIWPGRVVTIDARADADEVHRRVVAAAERYLHASTAETDRSAPRR